MKVGDKIELQLLSLEHRDGLFGLVDANRAYLREWLPWLDMNRSASDTESFIRSVIAQRESGKGSQFAVLYENSICGVCGFHPIDTSNNIGSIGYWLGEYYSGKGIITKTVKALLEVGFHEYHLNRLEIACATDNHRSRAIPERLKFGLEGVLREREYLYGKYVDIAIYSMLASGYARNGRLQADAAVKRL